METNLTQEEIESLKKDLETTKQELEKAKQDRIIIQQPQNTQDKLVELLIEKGGPLLVDFMKMSGESNRYQTDKEVELEKEEIKIINKLDSKEKLYKGVMLTICIVALILSSMYLPKAEVIIPVLTLIIGLLFKTNTLSDFFSHMKGKFDKNDD